MDTAPGHVLITGVSSGIGHGLARWYLDQGWVVYGTSRRTPDDVPQHDAFRFVSLDLSDAQQLPGGITDLIDGVERLDLAILNAGVVGRFGDIGEAGLGDLKNTMQVNVWANKLILDALFARHVLLEQVVAISSGASVNGNRGWSGYSISKAALNMLVKLYARERPGTHFCALAPGLVDTEIQDEICTRVPDERYPSVERLRSKRHTPEMPAPAEAAPLLARTFARLPSLVESGEYADIRQLPS